MARADGSGCAAAGSGQLRGARRFVARRRGAILRAQARGGMAEWLKAHAWKACIRETVSWVRIPLPPPPTVFAVVRRRSEIPEFSSLFATSRLCAFATVRYNPQIVVGN